MMSLTTFTFAGTSMKLEGSCTGHLAQEVVTFNYYSNFDGCRLTHNSAALSFTSGKEDLFTGTRSFQGNKDIYELGARKGEKIRLEFLNSTGNTSGKVKYKNRTTTFQCAIRDYEYAECNT